MFYFYLSCAVGIRACMEEMNLIEEELYEVDLDNQGCQGGLKAGRLRALANVSILSCPLEFQKYPSQDNHLVLKGMKIWKNTVRYLSSESSELCFFRFFTSSTLVAGYLAREVVLEF
jgi:hypothetical protein